MDLTENAGSTRAQKRDSEHKDVRAMRSTDDGDRETRKDAVSALWITPAVTERREKARET